MKNKKYISQVLACLFTGMIIPIFIIFTSKYYIHRTDAHFMYIVAGVGLLGFILEVLSSSRFDKTKNKIWILAQLLFYFSFWIFMGILLGVAYVGLKDAGYIILYVYGVAFFVTIVCLIIGLYSKNINLARKGNIIWGFIISFIITIFVVITKSYNRFVTLALLVIVFLCCYYSIKQFNGLKSFKHFNSKAEELSDIIETSMSMGITFITFVFSILAIIFHNDDDD